MNIEYNGTVYFTEKELQCNGSGMLRLAEGFPEALLALRLAWNRPMTLTSACRSMKYNKEVGGSMDSFHICDHPSRDGTAAVDVWIEDSVLKREFMLLAGAHGFSIGIPKHGFIHIDRRDFFGYEPIVFGY